MTDKAEFNLKSLVQSGLERALNSQQPLAEANVARLRRVHPGKSPAELIALMNKWYIGSVAATGAGAGAAAAVPNGFVQFPAAAADLLANLEASVLYALSLAEIYEIDLENFEQRKLLVLAVLLGPGSATSGLETAIGRTAPHWGKTFVKGIPNSAIKRANKVLGPRFITKWGTKQGVLVLGKQAPLMIGAALGGGGNGLLGWFVVRSARKILGPPPEAWRDQEAELSEGDCQSS